jgi:hypothetical protein
MSDVHGVQVQGGTFPAQIWHAYTARTLGHSRPGTFQHGGWELAPYHGRRSMRHPQ